MRFIALILSSFLLAHAAIAQGPKPSARHLEMSSGSPSDAAFASRSLTTFAVPPLHAAELAPAAWAVAPEARTEGFPSLSFRRSTGDAFVAIRAVPGDSQTPVQLLAAFGLRNFSFRVSSWRRLGSGPSVNAGTLSVVRTVNFLPAGPNTGFGLSLTMYRVGSRFDPVYGRRPVSIQFLFRIRFGSGAASLVGPIGRSANL